MSLSFHEHVFVYSKYNFIANVHDIVCVQDEKSLTLYIHINSIGGKTVVICVNLRKYLSNCLYI